MTLSFNGTTDLLQATIAAMDTGDWTIGAWVYPLSTGEGAAGRVMLVGRTGAAVLAAC